jgi:phosphatidylinositol alpha-1,6-mannosyltransferase
MPCRTRWGGVDVEGLGIVFLEASATGLPVVAGDSGGAPEAVRHRETGLVVDGGNVEEIAAALIELLANPDQARKLGAAGRDWIVREWSWDQAAARFRALL